MKTLLNLPRKTYMNLVQAPRISFPSAHESNKKFLNETVGQHTKEFLNGTLETTKDTLHHLGKSTEEANLYDATENTTQANDSTTSNGEDTAGYL
uniref:Rhoptry-associated protein 1 (RAP-1) n=1 Tax=Babesia bovis TaxID=5865 RepID=S6BNC6_BABBO|nr:rhoptry-associated protein 1 (RAP-1) [Babesia bovis]